MRALTLALLGAGALAGPLLAGEQPKAGRDPLIRKVTYDPMMSYELTSTNGEPLVIVLEPGEAVRTVAGMAVTLDAKEAQERAGQVWFVASNLAGPKPAADPDDGKDATEAKDARPAAAPKLEILDQISFQPTGASIPPTIVRVLTQGPDGKPRPYVFRLSTRAGKPPPDGKPDPEFYVQVIVEHRKPVDPAAAAVNTAARVEQVRQQTYAHASARLNQDRYSAPRNRDYALSDGVQSPGGCDALRPAEISDDFVTTTVLISNGRPAPQFYAFNLASEPMLLTPSPETRPEGTLYTFAATYREMRLVLENQVCGLLNRGWRSVSPAPGGGTGTISPYVQRRVAIATPGLPARRTGR